MIPLRRFLIRNEHGNLPYPEGIGSAEVLVAADTGGTQAKNVFYGLGIGFLYTFLMDIIKLFPRDVWVKIPSLKTGTTSICMYYNNDGADSGENVTGVWDDNYRMVQHLQETSGEHYDSTKYSQKI